MIPMFMFWAGWGCWCWMIGGVGSCNSTPMSLYDDSCRVLTYLARRCITSAEQDKMVSVFSCRQLWHHYFSELWGWHLNNRLYFGDRKPWQSPTADSESWMCNASCLMNGMDTSEWIIVCSCVKQLTGGTRTVSIWSCGSTQPGFHLVMMNCQSSAPSQQPGAVNQTPSGRKSRVNVKKSVWSYEWKWYVKELWLTKEEVCKIVLVFCFLFVFVVFPLQYVTLWIIECTEVLNADTCTVFIVFTMIVVWMFSNVCGSGAVLQLRVVFSSPSSVQLLWGRCARQLWGYTSGLYSQVVLLIGVHWV